MSIPITKRVMVAGSKKGCGCCGACQCDKSPAKFNDELRAEAEKPNSDMNDGFREAVLGSPANKNYGASSVAKMWGAAKVAHGKKSSPATKRGCGMKY